ncbi:two-component sensor histidine kinase [Pseudomonas cichorii]|uniref:sensor histidine kinase n=1 Tax=Pseudomonas cichorii TaxID=36746 RepID=UPI001910B2F7|nr:sensor histidine kinase [Pseudomonas cichorii]GFM83120.1 two-component sensor histidine kinase [Pseudomonas cichorii]
MKLPNRHSLLWKLIGGLALLCLLMASLQTDLNRRLNEATERLSEPTKRALTDYARRAEAAWQKHGASGVDEVLRELRSREKVWAVVVDKQQNSLSSQPLTEPELERLHFVRRLDGMVGRPGGVPTFYIPFKDTEARLVMDLPGHFHPRQHNELWDLLLQKVLPASLALLLAALLYRILISPIVILHRQANALSTGDLAARVEPQVAERRDELGELARAFNHMAGRLENTVVFQRRLLRTLSHELRTPLSRLRAAGERELDIDTMRQRQEREVQIMEKLISDTLELVWLDTERPALPLETVEVKELWNLLCEDVCFETNWPMERLPCDLPSDCYVSGNLNGLAQALENILRNAIRHSPDDGVVRLTGCREGGYWHLWVEDQGPGIEPEKLEHVFQPFTRLNAERPGGEGFGLGLSIARSIVELQNGQIWAENATPGLRLHLRLRSV